jgi:hypothetical protein
MFLAFNGTARPQKVILRIKELNYMYQGHGNGTSSVDGGGGSGGGGLVKGSGALVISSGGWKGSAPSEANEFCRAHNLLSDDRHCVLAGTCLVRLRFTWDSGAEKNPDAI